MVRLPHAVTLDTRFSDQQLGTLELPHLGWVDLALQRHGGGGTWPEYAYLRLVPQGKEPTPENTRYIGLRPPAASAEVGPLAAGKYDCDLTVFGFRAEPTRVSLEIEPGRTTPLGFQLHPEGLIYSVVQVGGDVPFRRITLRGAGIERVLEPASETPADWLKPLGSYADGLYRYSFEFHDLPDGTYDLTIEAEGYALWRGTRTVTAGVGERKDIRLVRGE